MLTGMEKTKPYDVTMMNEERKKLIMFNHFYHKMLSLSFLSAHNTIYSDH